MNDDIILKLLLSSNFADLSVGMNILAQKNLEEISIFFDKYGGEKVDYDYLLNPRLLFINIPSGMPTNYVENPEYMLIHCARTLQIGCKETLDKHPLNWTRL